MKIKKTKENLSSLIKLSREEIRKLKIILDYMEQCIDEDQRHDSKKLMEGVKELSGSLEKFEEKIKEIN